MSPAPDSPDSPPPSVPAPEESAGTGASANGPRRSWRRRTSARASDRSASRPRAARREAKSREEGREGKDGRSRCADRRVSVATKARAAPRRAARFHPRPLPRPSVGALLRLSPLGPRPATGQRCDGRDLRDRCGWMRAKPRRPTSSSESAIREQAEADALRRLDEDDAAQLPRLLVGLEPPATESSARVPATPPEVVAIEPELPPAEPYPARPPPSRRRSSPCNRARPHRLRPVRARTRTASADEAPFPPPSSTFDRSGAPPPDPARSKLLAELRQAELQLEQRKMQEDELAKELEATEAGWHKANSGRLPHSSEQRSDCRKSRPAPPRPRPAPPEPSGLRG